MEVNGSLVEWAGRVVFFERWASDDMNGNAEDDKLHAEMQGLEGVPRGGRPPTTSGILSVCVGESGVLTPG